MCPDDLDSEHDEITGLLARLDHPMPHVSVSMIIAKAVARRRAPATGTRLRWAAAIALMVGATGLALAAPGSPLRRWVTSVADGIGVARSHAPPPSITPQRPTAGIALSPAGRLIVILSATRSDAVARISLGGGAELEARAPSGAATFTTGPDRLLVELGGAGDTLTLTIPRSAARVEVLTANTRVLSAVRGTVTSSALRDSLGGYTVPVPSSRAP
jgi:hypothetical protein